MAFTPSKEAQDWVKKQFEKSRKPSIKRGKIQIGKIYHYDYKAKGYHDNTPRTLPFYDSHPLIICIGLYSNGWLGLNLHYLPLRTRRYFLEKVLLKNYKRIGSGKNLKLPYKDIKNVYNLWFKEGIAIIKRYLSSHVKSNVVEVPSSEWVNIISTEKMMAWVGTSASQVYGQTKHTIKKAKKKSYNVRYRTKQKLKTKGLKTAMTYAKKQKKKKVRKPRFKKR